MFDKIKVSVVIPIWNTEKYIEKCLESLIHQTLQDIEIICVNNGSTDNCAQILETYKQNDERIKIITLEHGYLSDARNVGIKEAVGEYLYCIDSDDWLELTALEKWYNQAKSKNADVVLVQEVRFSEELQQPVNAEQVSLKLYGCDDNGVYTYKDMKRLFMSRYCAWMHFYNREFFIKNDLFYPSETFYEDVSVHFKTIFTAKRIAVVTEPLHNFYVRIKSSFVISHNTPEKLDTIKYINFLYNLLEEKKLFKLFKYEFVNWLFGEMQGHIGRANPQYKQKLAELFTGFISEHKLIEDYINSNPNLEKRYGVIKSYLKPVQTTQKVKQAGGKPSAKKFFKFLLGSICFPYYVYKTYQLLKERNR